MPQDREDGRILICPHCHRGVSNRVLIIYVSSPGPAFSGPSVWHCLDCGGEWPRKPATKKQEE